MSRYGLGVIKITKEDTKNLKEKCGSPLNKIEDGEYIIDYGFDHALGYFLMGFDAGDPGEIAFDFDSLFHGLTGVSLGYFLSLYGAPESHIEQSSMDRRF